MWSIWDQPFVSMDPVLSHAADPGLSDGHALGPCRAHALLAAGALERSGTTGNRARIMMLSHDLINDWGFFHDGQ